MALLARLKQRARLLKRDTYALYLAARDPRTPWYAKSWPRPWWPTPSVPPT
jgi:uncharacterized membrane protein YkvA (DUF1232 family)